MKEDNKYYTPEISEFHVGFQFEFEGMDCNWNKTGFSKEKVLKDKSDYFGLYTLDWVQRIFELSDTYSVEKSIRVKYLDSSDIESLGFSLYKVHPRTTTHEFQSKDSRYMITFDPDFGKGWNITIMDELDFIFLHGYIKNISELKIVLKQIGVL